MADRDVPLPGSIWKNFRGERVTVKVASAYRVQYLRGDVLCELNFDVFHREHELVEKPAATPVITSHPLLERINALRFRTRYA